MNPILKDLLNRAEVPTKGKPLKPGSVVLVLGGGAAHGDFNQYAENEKGELVKTGEYLPQFRDQILQNSITPEQYQDIKNSSEVVSFSQFKTKTLAELKDQVEELESSLDAENQNNSDSNAPSF